MSICNFNLENIGQGHEVQLPQCRYAMTDIKIICHIVHFALAPTVCELSPFLRY